MRIEFWFDFGSTYSYPAALRIEQLTAERDLDLQWRPFLLGVIFNRQGIGTSPFKTHPEMERYMWRDVTRVCNDLSIAFNQPKRFPQNGLLGARVANHFAGAPWVSAFIRALFAANFEHDRDIALTETVADCLKAV
ncbi:MAG: DsbA family protein, partial [Pseudomonadota bacterium]